MAKILPDQPGILAACYNEILAKTYNRLVC